MNCEELLSHKITMADIRDVVAWTGGDISRLNYLWSLASCGNTQISTNALWIMTRLPDSDMEWIISLRDEMIDMLLAENNVSKKRILLKILREQEYDADNIRTDFLDFCMSKINSECEPYAIRCFCMYAAFKMCRHYTELITELEHHLEMMSYQSLSPGLQSALRQTNDKIRKIKKLR